MLQRNAVNQTREYAAKLGRADASGFRKPDDPRWYRADRPMYKPNSYNRSSAHHCWCRYLEMLC
jgi:hypothetical protein